MINKIKHLVFGFMVLFGLGVVLLPAANVGAVTAIEDACRVDPQATICKDDTSASDLITTIINVLLFVVGIISVVMIIVAGIMYTTSGGDSAAVTKAKGTLLYAIVGLVVAFLAYAIVNWVLKVLT